MSVYTVLGVVPASHLGKTLTHEHFNLNFEKFYCSPPDKLKEFFESDIHLGNVGFVKQYPYSSEVNLKLFGKQVDNAVLKDVSLFKKCGGGTIVENTTHGLDRNLNLMVEVSKQTGVNIIAGTGYYVEGVQSDSDLTLKKEDMYNTMKSELINGCIENPEIKAGFIGEVGSSWPITDFEKRSIAATGEVQEELKCGVSFHPGRSVQAPLEILRIYSEAGGNLKKAVMSHLDRTLESENQLIEFSEDVGSYCQFDLFGTECSLYQLNLSQDMLSDAQRIKWVSALIKANKTDRILLSHDIHTRHRLTEFGGHGYNHIITNVVPKMINYRNILPSQINQILENNPAKWLQNNL